MRPDYQGTKYYGHHNIDDVSPYKAKIQEIINHNPSINEILELYNIDKMLCSQIQENKKKDYQSFDELHKLCLRFIGVSMSSINDKNFSQIERNVTADYYDDFWSVFTHYKVYERVSNDTFKAFLFKEDTVLAYLVSNKNLVEYYGNEFKEAIQSSSQSMSIISKIYLECSDSNYYLPTELTPKDIGRIIEKYVDSESPNPNTLQLIINAPNNKHCPISAKLKAKAKRKFEEFFKKNKDNITTHKYRICVTLKKQDDIKLITRKGNDITYSIDLDWLSNHLDYPTILNNFIFVFDFFDFHCRSKFPSLKKNISPLEDVFRNRGKKYYPIGDIFNDSQILQFGYMECYRNFLLNNNIDFEQVIKWFFEIYLPKEFQTEGFVYNKSTEQTSYLEKCKNLCSEIESVLAQFQLYAQEKEIDRELLELSTSGTNFSKIPSLIDTKYIYSKSPRIKQAMSLLFSEQSPLAYICEDYFEHPSFFFLITNNKISLKILNNRQREYLTILLDLNLIEIIDDGVIKPKKILFVLFDLFNNEVVCYHYLSAEEKNIVNKMILSQDLSSESTLFSIPESQYLSYMLNDQLYSNGLEIRNKYSHGKYPPTEKKRYENYIFLLNIMIMIIVKINEEALWRAEINKNN